MAESVRVTTDPDYYQEHSDSVELWSPGSPLFPAPEVVASQQELAENLTVDAILSGTPILV
jgi:hypothetical protein